MATFKQKALDAGMLYTVSDIPPAGLGILLGMQHYLTMLGATVLIPIILVPAMGGTGTDTAEVISTIFFVSGLNTLIQTTFGDRLPIIQGGSFAFLNATFGIIGLVGGDAHDSENDRFKTTMCTIQGSVIVCALTQIALGYSGVMTFVLRFISPLTIAPTVTMVGLGLYAVPGGWMKGCEWFTFLPVIFIPFFSHALKKVVVKVGGVTLQVFSLFPVIWTILFSWGIALIVQAAGGMEVGGDWETCRSSDQIIKDSKGAKFPYPGQWGKPIFRGAAIGPMIGAMMVSMVESIGDYYACAGLAGAPPPSGAIISRGLGGEGFGLLLCGLFGTSNGTTSYGENIGALSVTRVGSRAVVQAGACVMLIVGLFPKFGAVFASMPLPLVGGLYMCLFGLIAATGLSSLQHCDLNSSRNLYILGFALFNGLAIAGPSGYFSIPPNPFTDDDAGEVGFTFLNNTMVVAFLSGLVLDNIIPGTREERGLSFWDQARGEGASSDPEFQSVYGLPWCLAKGLRNCVYLDFIENGFKWPKTPEGGHQASKGDCCEMFCPCVPAFKQYDVDKPATVTAETPDKTADA